MSSVGGAQTLSSSQEILKTHDPDAARRGAIELRRVAACAYRDSVTMANLLLASKPGSRDEERVGDAMTSRLSRCISVTTPYLRWSWAELRGAVAEAAYTAAPANKAEAGTEPMPLPAAWLAGPHDAKQTQLLLAHEFGQCVVFKQAGDAAAMIRAEPRSAEERHAIGVLTPSFGPCLTQGATMSLDPASLRALLAQALYRTTDEGRAEMARAGGRR